MIFALIGWVGWLGYEQVAEHWEVAMHRRYLRPFSESDDNTIALPQQTNADPDPSEQPAVPDRSGSVATLHFETPPAASAPPPQTTASGDAVTSEPASETASTQPTAATPAEDFTSVATAGAARRPVRNGRRPTRRPDRSSTPSLTPTELAATARRLPR
ncbi:MAG: hypothetical protein R3F37_00985 [Candidatus Competibacteraceae bacterium]